MPELKPVFLVYSTTTVETIQSSLGEPEYSYFFVLQSYVPVLERIGEVVLLKDPATEADSLYESYTASGRYCVMLAFCPPDHLMLDLECPVIPVFAWEYENIPNETWDNNMQADWRYSLGRAGWAITHSTHTVRNVKQHLRRSFPIVCAPAPLWDKYAGNSSPRRGAALSSSFDLTVEKGYLVDSREIDLQVLSPLNEVAELEVPPLEQARTITLDGAIYTSIFNPRDGRKNWHDIFWAFCWAFKDNPDATLVLKLTCYDPDQMIDLLLYDLYKLTPFQCRVIAIGGYLSDESYDGLALNTTYAVNASRGEGQCLPLMEYMSGGVPAISPSHTGMLDYVTEENSLIVDSSLEPTNWPQDPRQYYRTKRHRVDWESLHDAYKQSYRIAKEEPSRYEGMSGQAVKSLEKHCSQSVVENTLKGFFDDHAKSLARYSVDRPFQPPAKRGFFRTGRKH